MKLREALAALLRQNGIDTLFGLIGDGNMHLVTDAVRQQGIRFVNARHETAAVWMADGYARAGRRIAAATVTHGPGLAAAGLGLGVAQVARTPLLLIVGDVDRAAPLHVQAMDQERFASALVADVVSIRTARGALPTLMRLFERLQRGDGPIVLSVAVDVQEEDIGSELPPARPLPLPARPALADDAALDRLAERLSRSQRPIVLAGRGAMAAAPQLIALAQRCDALLATTIPARGLFDGDPRDLGVMGGLSQPASRLRFAQADLVLAFGAGLNRWTADHGRIAPEAEWLQVALGDAPGCPQVAVSLAVRGDAADTAARLLQHMDGDAVRWGAAPIPASHLPDSAASPPGTLHPLRVVQAVNAAITPQRTDIVGVGHFGGWPAIHTHVGRDGQFIAPWDFGAIGVAVPFATGAALARPDRPTIAWEGDGSLLTALGELETLARSGARVAVVVLDDGAYTAEVRKLRLLDRDHGLATFGRADLAGAARALGVSAHTVTDEASLAQAVGAVAQAPGPVLVHVHIDPEAFQEVF